MNAITSLLPANGLLYIGIAAALLAVIWFWEPLTLWWNTPRTAAPTVPGAPAKATKPGIPTRRQVLDYLDASYAYFENEKCKEGMAAIQDAVKHSFHEHDAAGNAVPGAR